MGINKTNGGTEKTEKAKSVEERMGGGKAYSKEIKINEKQNENLMDRDKGKEEKGKKQEEEEKENNVIGKWK